MRVDEAGASGVAESAGVDLEMQHGQCLEHEAVQDDLALIGAEAKPLPDDTTRLATSTTSQRTINTNVVFARLI